MQFTLDSLELALNSLLSAEKRKFEIQQVYTTKLSTFVDEQEDTYFFGVLTLGSGDLDTCNIMSKNTNIISVDSNSQIQVLFTHIDPRNSSNAVIEPIGQFYGHQITFS